MPESPSYRRTFARLLGFLRPYKLSLVVSILLAAASQAAQVAIVFLTGSAVGRAIGRHDRRAVELTVVGVTGVMLFVNWRLALVALAISPLLVAFAYRYSHIAHPLLRDVQQRMADVATVAEESIVGVHVVKSFAQEPAEQAKFEQRSESVFEQSVRANRQRAFYVPLMSFLPLP